MKFELRLFDKKGKELELENEIFDGIPFESEKAIEDFLHVIKGKLPAGFQYKIIPYQNEKNE